MSRVDKLTITGYKSIEALRDFELRSLNVLIGANGAGKSNFISLFRMLAEMADRRLQLYVQKQGGPDALLHFTRKTTERIHGEILFGRGSGSYRFDLVATNDNRLVFEDEQDRWTGDAGESHSTDSIRSGHAESAAAKLRPHRSIQTPTKDWRVYHFHDTGDTAKVKQVHAINDTLRLKADGANLAAFLRLLRRDHHASYQRIEETIRLAAPFFGGFVQRDTSGDSIELEWFERRDPETPLKAHVLSDGTLRFICLTTLLLQPAPLLPPTILIDEPELGLHPYAVNVLGDLLKRAAEETQLIVSTQSVELLDCFEPEDVVVVDRVKDASTFRRLDTAQLASWLEDYTLGDLWKQNVLGGRPA